VNDDTQRLFIAVPLCATLLPTVGAAQRLLPALPGLRLMRDDQLHVTLAFIGEVDADKARAAQAVVGQLPDDSGGEARISRFLMLPSSRRARVVALELDDASGVLAGLYERVTNGLESASVMQREKRPFRAHLTVARLRVPGQVVPKSECDEAPFPVESVCLFRSELKRDGAVYTVLKRKTLRSRHG
jgi:2'-5' RNA ligase